MVLNSVHGKMVNQQGIFQPDLIARYLETAYVRPFFESTPLDLIEKSVSWAISYHWFMEIWNQQRMETLGIKNIPWRFHKLEHSIGITLWNSWDSLTAFDCQGLKMFKENKLSYRLLYPYYIICLEGFGSITPDSVFYYIHWHKSWVYLVIYKVKERLLPKYVYI